MDEDAVAQRVMNLIESVNQFELRNSELMAVYKKRQGFVQEFKVYYEVGDLIYEGHVTYDILRRRSLIRGFGRLGF